MRRRTSVCCVVALGLCAAGAQAQTAYIIDSDGTNHLWSLNLATGVATDIGLLNFSQIEGLATSPGGVIYGVDDSTETLVTINTTTAVATAVGSGNGNLGVSVSDLGLTFDSAGNLWLSSEGGGSFYSVNPATGVATLITSGQSPDLTGLAACGTTIFGLVDGEPPGLAGVDPATGIVTAIGQFTTIDVPNDGGLAMGSDGVLYGIADNNDVGPSPLFRIDPTTGSETLVANITDGVNPLSGIESFTSASPPPSSCSFVAAVPLFDAAGLGALAVLLAAIALWVLRTKPA